MSTWNVFLDVVAIVAKTAAVFTLLLLVRGIAWLLNMFFILPLFDPLNDLPGPHGSAFQTHMPDVLDPTCTPHTHIKWKKKFGHTLRYHGFGKHDYRLLSLDFRVISHVLTSPLYEKPWQTRALFARITGRGLFSKEGAEHKFLRRLIAPAFTLQSVKVMTPVFFQKAEELCQRWDSLIDEPFTNPGTRPSNLSSSHPPSAASEKPKDGVVDVAHWLARASFDVIGLAGFGYHFNALERETEAAYVAFRRVVDVANKAPQMRTVLYLFFPILRKIWPDESTKTTDESLHVIYKTGKKLIADRRAAILAEHSSIRDIEDKSILNILIKANLSNDPSTRLSDADLVDQCSTFLLAGSETVSLAIAWCLHFLSQNPEIQTQLREEILSAQKSLESKVFDTDAGAKRTSSPLSHPISMQTPQERWEALDKLPYLNAVVRETLRFCPSVHSTIRVATSDDRIPISHPIVLRDGTVVEKDGHISIRKGSYIHIPIEGVNLSEEIWGSDARSFNPDRWVDVPRSSAQPSLGHLLTFLLGPHSCVGNKFSVVQIKVFLAVILSRFVFTPAEGVEIAKFNVLLTRPFVRGKWELGTSLPIHMRRYTR
ncbi:cytochrome P450 [Tricholoma matsutake]|nr:cytochrome P450 [Tricholoma matsutake 945]